LQEKGRRRKHCPDYRGNLKAVKEKSEPLAHELWSGIRSQSMEVLPQLCTFMHRTEGKTVRTTSAEGSGHLNPPSSHLR